MDEWTGRMTLITVLVLAITGARTEYRLWSLSSQVATLQAQVAALEVCNGE